MISPQELIDRIGPDPVLEEMRDRGIPLSLYAYLEILAEPDPLPDNLDDLHGEAFAKVPIPVMEALEELGDPHFAPISSSSSPAKASLPEDPSV